MRISELIETVGYTPLADFEPSTFFKGNAYRRLQSRQCPMCGTNLSDRNQLRLVGEHKQVSQTETWIVFGIRKVTKYKIKACYVPVCEGCFKKYDKRDWWSVPIWLGFYQLAPVMILAAYLNEYIQPFTSSVQIGSVALAGISVIAGVIFHGVEANASDAILQRNESDWEAGFPPRIDNWEFPTNTTAKELDDFIRNLRH